MRPTGCSAAAPSASKKVAETPGWLRTPGHLSNHLSFALDGPDDGGAAPTGRRGSRSRIVIFHAIGDEHKPGYYGVLTQGFPQLVRVNRDVLTRDNQTPVPAGQPMLCRVRMVHEFPLIPDLEAIEQRLAAIAA